MHMKPNSLTQRCAYVQYGQDFLDLRHFHFPTQCLVWLVLLALGFYTPYALWHLHNIIIIKVIVTFTIHMCMCCVWPRLFKRMTQISQNYLSWPGPQLHIFRCHCQLPLSYRNVCVERKKKTNIPCAMIILSLTTQSGMPNLLFLWTDYVQSLVPRPVPRNESQLPSLTVSVVDQTTPSAALDVHWMEWSGQRDYSDSNLGIV